MVAPPSRIDETRALVKGVADQVAVVAGGLRRQDSVEAGLDAMADAARVIVQDAARPLVTVELIQRVIGALDGADGAIPVIPVEDTLKRLAGGVAAPARVETVDRADLYRAQTPGGFHTPALREAHVAARRDGFAATDEAQLLERSGMKLAFVEGSRRNIKVTYDEDFALAEALLGRRDR